MFCDMPLLTRLHSPFELHSTPALVGLIDDQWFIQAASNEARIFVFHICYELNLDRLLSHVGGLADGIDVSYSQPNLSTERTQNAHMV